jgi:type IV pilus assembly protein PilA
MLARLRKSEDHEGGFTLIELLVVMIIIGILAAIAIPAFLSQKKKGYEASQKSDLRAIATEISTALVDSPAEVGITGTTSVTVTPKAGAVATADETAAAATLPLSPGNTLASGVVNTTAGSYCIRLTHDKLDSGSNWKISSTGSGASQVLGKGAC